VTSSNTSSAGACSGLGVSPKQIHEVYGIFKAYCTRVGSGPFPTELFDETGQAIQKIGREFGATTGRPRRCGWLDLPALKYASMINGVTALFMMKADVLSEFDELQVCTHYRLEDGTLTDQMPFDLTSQKIEPIYKSFTGWQTTITDVADTGVLPVALEQYIQFIENEMQIPVKMISVGPDRSQTIIRGM
jgi:adenylosuccinate synthase